MTRARSRPSPPRVAVDSARASSWSSKRALVSCSSLDVGRPLVALIPDGRLGRLEVRMLHHEQSILAGVGQRPQHRVAVADVQPAARPQQIGDDRRPSAGCRAASRAHRRRCRRGRTDRRPACRRRSRPRTRRRSRRLPRPGPARRASASAGGEMSRPVIRAPSRGSETVSVPMWHWRWTPLESRSGCPAAAGRTAPPRSGTPDLGRSARRRSRVRWREPGRARPGTTRLTLAYSSMPRMIASLRDREQRLAEHRRIDLDPQPGAVRRGALPAPRGGGRYPGGRASGPSSR